jgi:hypothetical protein
MTREQAIEILGTDIQADGRLFCGGRYLAWAVGDEEATLDADFTADELEAIAWWMRNSASAGGVE